MKLYFRSDLFNMINVARNPLKLRGWVIDVSLDFYVEKNLCSVKQGVR